LDQPTEAQTAGLGRRLAALTYDTLLVCAVLMLVTLAFVALRGGKPVEPGNIFLQFSLFATTGIFFTGFWVSGGQTLGMRAWRLKVEQRSGEPITWGIACIRFLAGLITLLPLGAGLIWALFDPAKLALYDRISGTRVILLPKSR
jgi:uncharacterized RDD family membrane protein YckC